MSTSAPVGKSYRSKLIVVTAIAAFMAFLDATIVNVAFPDVRDHFPSSTSANLSWILNAYNIVFAAFLVPSGRIADRWGRKRVFLLGMALFTIGSGACAAAPSVDVLTAARAVQALGAAAMVPCAQALLISAFPRARMGSAVAIFGGTAAFAAGVGPALGGLLVDLMDWRLVFLVNIPVGILALGAIVLWVKEDGAVAGASQKFPDVLGAVFAAISVGLLALAVTKAPEWEVFSWKTFVTFDLAVVFGVWLYIRSRSHPSPIIEPSLFRHRSFAVGNIATTLFAVSYFGTILANVLFLTEVWGYSVLAAGLAVSAPPAAAVVVAGPAGRIYDKFGSRAVLLPGAIFAAVGTWLYYLLVDAQPNYVGSWLPAAIVCGAGFGMVWPALGSMSVSSIPSAEYAVASGVNNATRQVGGVVGVAIAIAVLTDATPVDALNLFGNLWIAFAAVAAVAGVVAVSTTNDRVGSFATESDQVEGVAR